MTTGCQKKIEFTGEPHEQLMQYVLLEPADYYGDGNYYHEIQSVDWSDEDGTKVLILSGEVKSTGPLKRFDEKKFQVKNYIDSVKWVQTGHSQVINDSEFKEVIILHLPLEEGNQWHFNTETFDGTKVKVTGTLKTIDENEDALMITYTSNRGHEETRWLKKNKGTTSFIKKLDYKSTFAYTGYHFETYKVDLAVGDQLIPVAVESELYDLLDAHYASLLETLSDIKRIDYKIYDTEQKESGYLLLRVVEEWLLYNDQQMITQVKYHIDWSEEMPAIIETETIND